MMQWNVNHLIEHTVRKFCEVALPDAHDIDDLSYAIVPDDDKLRVEMDIPTSEMEAWLMLAVDVDGYEPVITGLSCLRSGIGERSEEVYEWTQNVPEWTARTDV